MKHYRLYDTYSESGDVIVSVNVFKTYKETPCGYWVIPEFYTQPWMTFEQLKKRKYLRWVSKTSTKRYCHPTIEDAMKSYKARKIQQIRIIDAQFRRVNAIVNNFQTATVDELIRGVIVEEKPLFNLTVPL